MQIKDLILVSDLDGTIIPTSGKISQKNLDAIEKFRRLGGTFTVATGRPPIQTKSYLKDMSIDCPIIGTNGAVIYDPKTDENLWMQNFNLSYKEVIHDLKKQFPNVGIISVSGKDTYNVIANNRLVEVFKRTTKVAFSSINEVDPPDECSKVLFGIEEADLLDVSTYLAYKKYNDVEFVLSPKDYIEMLPKGVSKGYAFERLIQIYGKKLENSVAIGDYDNDIGMIKKATIGVAVGNASENLKAVADLVVKSCDDNGLADLIEYLINNIDKI